MGEKAYFKLLVDLNGEVVGAELTQEGKDAGCVLTQGREVTPDFLAGKFIKHQNWSTTESGAIKLSSSPGCIIYIGGWPICICC